MFQPILKFVFCSRKRRPPNDIWAQYSFLIASIAGDVRNAVVMGSSGPNCRSLSPRENSQSMANPNQLVPCGGAACIEGQTPSRFTGKCIGSGVRSLNTL